MSELGNSAVLIENQSGPAADLSPVDALIQAIGTYPDLSVSRIRELAAAAEDQITKPGADKVGLHREVGKAIFARSDRLYCGDGLPECLVRYTYPAFLSVLLNTHCNAACFFCRESDYKGMSIEFEQVYKLENAIKYARTVDLTGWGEPFFYPRYEDVVKYVCATNPAEHLIQITSNGSFLSKKWGQLLRGRISSLIISLNAGTAETYEQQMRYKNKKFTFEKTLDSIREFQGEITEEDRRRMDIHVVCNTGNFRELTRMAEIAGELKIPLLSVGHYICAQEKYLDQTLWSVKSEYNAELRRARERGRELGVTVAGRSFFAEQGDTVNGVERCVAPFDSIFIEVPGTTTPCCFMGTERLGNVYESGFEAVWFSDVFNKLRKNRFLPPCKVCTIFTPFDKKLAHMSAFLTTKEEEVVLGGGPKLRTLDEAVL